MDAPPDQVRVSPEGIAFTLRRSGRARRIRITVGRAGVVLVVPARGSLARAEEFLRAQEGWIRRRLETLARQAPGRGLPANILPLFGEPHPVRVEASISSTGRAWVHRSPEGVLVRVPHARIDLATRALERWMRGLAERHFAERVPSWCERMRVAAGGITVRGQKSRWGSCGANGALSFNWRALLTPEATVDYLIVHECAHLRHMNHGPSFWAMVERFCPDYRQERLRLRNSSHLLGPDWLRLEAPAIFETAPNSPPVD